MSSSRLIRLGGLAALVGFAVMGIIDAVYPFVFPDTVALSVQTVSDVWFVLHLLYIIAQLLALLGLIGLYTRQAEKTGVLGLIAVLIAFVGFALLFAWEWSETFIWPALAHAAPRFLDHPDQNLVQALSASQTIHWLLIGVGLILFGVATLRARVLPRGAAVLVSLGMVVALVVNVVGVEVPFVAAVSGPLPTLGLAWMGYAVWSQRGTTAASPASSTAGRPAPALR
jgi:hypothetical protein